MKKSISLLFCLSVLLMGSLLAGGIKVVRADWWERPSVRPTQPSIERDLLPTSTPTQPNIQPTVTSTPIGGLPTTAPTSSPSSDGGTTENACASGKSYSGPYCGWSPEKDTSQTTTGGGGEVRIGGPEVLGLSYTGSSDLKSSDIILLTGVLCLLLYLRSKLPKTKPV